MRSSFGDVGIARRTRTPVRRMAKLLPRDLPGEREHFAPIELADEVQRHLRRVQYEGNSPYKGRVNVIVGWESWSYAQKMAFLRAFVEDTSKDPAIADKAMRILRNAGVAQRDHRGAWEALLKWVQRNIAYQNEPGERFTSPQATLSTGGPSDCDDMAILLAALGNSIRLPWKFTLTGKNRKGERVRWVEGEAEPKDFNASHIFLCVGGPPFRPMWWEWAEPTLSVPLGWDLFKDKLPKNRADLSGHSISESVGAVTGGENALQKVKKHLGKVNWQTVVTYAISGLASAVLVKLFLGRESRRGR